MQQTLLAAPDLRQCRNSYRITASTFQIQTAMNVTISLSSSSSCLLLYWDNKKHGDTNSHTEKEEEKKKKNIFGGKGKKIFAVRAELSMSYLCYPITEAEHLLNMFGLKAHQHQVSAAQSQTLLYQR